MIKSITITNHLGESILLELNDPYKTGFAITGINGLGPVKATVNFTELATNDGAIDNSARLGTRNIVFSFLFIPNPTIEDVRLQSYKYFPVKKNITILIETDNRKCWTIGRVESNEPNIFSDKEGCQVSILCSSPYFYSTKTNSVTFWKVRPAFKFPFKNNWLKKYEPITDSSNEPITDSSNNAITSIALKKNKELKMGDIIHMTYGNLYYEGDEDIGVTLSIHAIGPVSGLIIYKVNTREILKFNDDKLIALVEEGISAGDDIEINTSRGEKTATILRGGVKTNILNALEKPITWFQLTKGDNMFFYTAENGSTNVLLTISNKIIYDGV